MKEFKIKLMMKKINNFQVVIISLFLIMIIWNISLTCCSIIPGSMEVSPNQLGIVKNLMINIDSINQINQIVSISNYPTDIYMAVTSTIPFGDFFLLFIPFGIIMIILMLIRKRKIKIKHR
ncbi:MAG: hypothetical protein ACFFBP_14570 [Promethearchaeota archaeon]